MISIDQLQELSKKYQTEFRNVVREYMQHLFLSFFYQLPESEKFLFKGGTALRIIYGSPRFSEDIDFTGQNIFSGREIEDNFIRTLSSLEKLGLIIKLVEAKPTTGGYLGIIGFKSYGLVEQIKFEISLRSGKKRPEITTIVNQLLPPYSISHLSGKNIVQEKISALLTRQKPRDFYDFYFILRHPELHKYIPNGRLSEIENVLGLNKINFRKELSILLPKSHYMILKNFRKNLIQELKRYAPKK